MDLKTEERAKGGAGRATQEPKKKMRSQECDFIFLWGLAFEPRALARSSKLSPASSLRFADPKILTLTSKSVFASLNRSDFYNNIKQNRNELQNASKQNKQVKDAVDVFDFSSKTIKHCANRVRNSASQKPPKSRHTQIFCQRHKRNNDAPAEQDV